MGLVNYWGIFVSNFATITQQLRQLTRQKLILYRLGNRKASLVKFRHVKLVKLSKISKIISKAPVLSYFHPLETKTVTDVSKQGLGAVLLRKNSENNVFWLVAFNSCSLPDAETRYSQTEREAFAASCERFKNNVYGLRLTVIADNKPLLKLYSSSCWEPPTRIHRWSLKTPRIRF